MKKVPDPTKFSAPSTEYYKNRSHSKTDNKAAKFIANIIPPSNIPVSPDLYISNPYQFQPQSKSSIDSTIHLQPTNQVQIKSPVSPETINPNLNKQKPILHIPGAFDIIQRGNLPSIVFKNDIITLETLTDEQIHQKL